MRTNQTTDILDALLKAHETYFDVQKDYTWHGMTFDGYAFFKEEASQYVLSKRAKLWGVDVFEHIFFICSEHLTLNELERWIEFIETDGLEKVQNTPDHMTTYLSMVFIVESADDDAAKLIQKTRFRKNFLFGFRGWCDLRLALIDISRNKHNGRDGLITNPRGKEMRQTLLNCTSGIRKHMKDKGQE